jgi:hypothetical protein
VSDLVIRVPLDDRATFGEATRSLRTAAERLGHHFGDVPVADAHAPVTIGSVVRDPRTGLPIARWSVEP